MARKTRTEPPAAPPEGIDTHLATLDRHHAQQQQSQADDVEQLREAWQGRVTTARDLLAQIERTRQAYGPIVDQLAQRDYAHLPPSPVNLNTVAAIQRTMTELSSVWESATQGLQRLIVAVEQLSPQTVHTFHANIPIYADYLTFYRHTPAGIATLWSHLQSHLQLLATRLESTATEETFAPLPKIPEPAPPAPPVELA
jgi:hypothetical protein